MVLDNLNTHFPASLIETFGTRKANRLLKKVKFIYTPKHGSWLNMAEIEINIMDKQCTGGRIKNKKKLESAVTAWANDRNEKQCKIDWTFTRAKADKKLSKHYVAKLNIHYTKLCYCPRNTLSCESRPIANSILF